MPLPVAPFAGAWIEIRVENKLVEFNDVAPFAGAWIEILNMMKDTASIRRSLPSRERGLKYRSSGRDYS